MDEPKYRIDILYGRIEIRSWLEYKDGKLIGMGGAKHYDREGNLLSYTESPTGVVATLGD